MRLIFNKEDPLSSEWEDRLEKAAEIALRHEGITDNAEISVSFVDAAEIRELNRTYRNVDKVTDVLSFPMLEREEINDIKENGPDEEVYGGAVILGDVVICEEQAGAQAEEYGHSYERELTYLFVHSILHLLGYDHMEEDEKKEMRQREECVMAELGLEREKETDYESLLKTASEAVPKAYAPFSGFRVGAALLAESGRIYTGVNVENSSYGGTICAERTAFVKAVSEGDLRFRAIAVVSEKGGVWPCGICRQFMQEFCDDDFEIISYDKDKNIKVYTMAEMMPEGFRLKGEI